jgi:hypothetical protein
LNRVREKESIFLKEIEPICVELKEGINAN